MASDRITVDEPLISTDVDKLIRTIAEQQRISLSELQQLSRIDKKNLDKWIRVLEDEGYITLEYGLRGTFILWNRSLASSDGEPAVHQHQPKILSETPTLPPSSMPSQPTDQAKQLGKDAPDQADPDQLSSDQGSIETSHSSDSSLPAVEAGADALGETETNPEVSYHQEFGTESSLEEKSDTGTTDGAGNAPESNANQEPKPGLNPEPDPEELLSQYLAKRRQAEHVPSAEPAKATELKLHATLADVPETTETTESTEPPDRSASANGANTTDAAGANAAAHANASANDNAQGVVPEAEYTEDLGGQVEAPESLAESVETSQETTTEETTVFSRSVGSEVSPASRPSSPTTPVASGGVQISDALSEEDVNLVDLTAPVVAKDEENANTNSNASTKSNTSAKPSFTSKNAAQKSPRQLLPVDTRELLNAYRAEIEAEKSEIARLKKEKEQLYRNKFSVLEGKMEADVVALTDAILEAQGRISELKEHVLALPDKIDELEDMQAQMDRLRTGGRAALERTRQKVDGFLDATEASKKELASKISVLHVTMDKELGKLTELERISSSADGRLAKMQAGADAARVQLDELTQVLSALSTDITKAVQAKNEVAIMASALKANISEQGEQLDALQAELGSIAETERWIREYASDYEAKILDVEDYVSKSEDGLAELKEAAEAHYLKKYLGELQELTDSCQVELDDAIEHERNIDDEIAHAKTRITELVRDSQELLRKLRSDPSLGKDFDSVRSLVRDRTAKVKSLIDEKSSERASGIGTRTDTGIGGAGGIRAVGTAGARSKPQKKKKK